MRPGAFLLTSPGARSQARLQSLQEEACLSERALLTSISKVFLENVVQLWLQASFFALIFQRLHHAGKDWAEKPKGLCSWRLLPSG